jgi:regulator of nonsense transcripts 2
MSFVFLVFSYGNIQFGERAPSPDSVVVLSVQENLGPSEEADAEFAKELAKMVSDSSAEARKVDKKTALALLDSAVLPPGVRKKRMEENDEHDEAYDADARNTMNFTVITKRGNKQHVRSFFFVSACFHSSDH